MPNRKDRIPLVQDILDSVSSGNMSMRDPATQHIQKVINHVRNTAEAIEKSSVEQDDNFNRLFDLLERSIDRGESIMKLETRLLDQIAVMIARAQVDKESVVDPAEKARFDTTIEQLVQLSVDVQQKTQPTVESRGSGLGQDLLGHGYKRALAKRMADAQAKGKKFGLMRKGGFYLGRLISQPFKDIYQDLVNPELEEEDDAPESFKSKISRSFDTERLLDQIKDVKADFEPKFDNDFRVPRGSKQSKEKEPKTRMFGKSKGGGKTSGGAAPKRVEFLLEMILKEVSTIRATLKPYKDSLPNRLKPASSNGVDKNLSDDFNKLSSSVDLDGNRLSDLTNNTENEDGETGGRKKRVGGGFIAAMAGGAARLLGKLIPKKAAAKATAKATAKASAKAGSKAAAKQAAKKAGTKAAGKAIAKGAGKSALKKIPIIGALAGLGFGAHKMLKGDLVGAGLEVASGAASMLPGVGTAASLALDGAIAAREIKQASLEASPQPTGDAVEMMTDEASVTSVATQNAPIVNVNNVVSENSVPDYSDIVGAVRSPDNSYMRFLDRRQVRIA